MRRFGHSQIFVLLIAVFASVVPSSCGEGNGDDLQVPPLKWAVRKPQFAQGFEWWGNSHGEEVMVTRHPRTGTPMQIVVKGDASVPLGLLDAKVTHIRPMNGVATTSTTHVYLLAAGSGWAPWVGGNSIQYLRDTTALSMISGGEALDLSGEPLMDAELLMAAAPGWVATMPHADVPKQWGQSTVEVMEYLEPHPLGRAEWMRAFGWMTDRASRSDSVFGSLALRYQGAKVKPTQPFRMFTGSIADGVWHAPGNESFVAQWIEDAGGTYMLEGSDSGDNVEVGLERMLSLADSAHAWVVVAYGEHGYGMGDLFAEDPRHRHAFDGAQDVWICNTAKADYFGALVVNPDWMLEDLVAMIQGATEGPNGLIQRMTP